MSIISLYLGACSTPKNITYFKDIPDTVKRKIVEESTYTTPIIQPDDILQVSIQTLDASATTILNQQNTAQWPVTGSGNPGENGTGSAGNISGYLVGKEGTVNLPLLGKISVTNKTVEQVRDDIQTKASEFYKTPIVNVRLANFKVTVLGEVAHPSTYIMPSEKVTIMDALGLAGDLTIYGKRENIMLIREKDGKKEIVRFNLNNSNLFSSPYFYLRQGDVVYVEPNKSKIIASDAARLRAITIFTAIVSIAVLILSRVH